MIGFYVMGGGFGHLSRVRNFIQEQRLAASQFYVITCNTNADRFFPKEQVIQIPEQKANTKKALDQAVNDVLSKYRIEILYIDTFPCGILRELSVPSSITLFYIGRRVRWKKYAVSDMSFPKFHTSYLYEELEPSHMEALERYSERIITLKPSLGKMGEDKRIPLSVEKPLWLVVHSTNQAELELLLQHAMDVAKIKNESPHYMVLSDQEPLNLPSEATWRTNEDPNDWYPMAGLIFTAAGFNTWYQTAPYREKHICLPFKRLFDDQFWRASQVNQVV